YSVSKQKKKTVFFLSQLDFFVCDQNPNSLFTGIMAEPIIPPLIQEFLNRFKEPFDMLTTLKELNVIPETPFFSTFLKPKIIVLGEECAGTTFISNMIGLSVPSGFLFPIVLKFENDSSRQMCYQILYEGRYSDKIQVHDENDLAEQLCIMDGYVPDEDKSLLEVTVTITQPEGYDFTVIILPEIEATNKGSVQISLYEGYITHYNTNDCMFMNVLGCSFDVTRSLSRKILKDADFFGRRTITVLTKLPLLSERLISKFTCNDIESTTQFGFFFAEYDEITVRDENDSKKVSDLLSHIDEEFVGVNAISKNIMLVIMCIMFHHSSPIVTRVESDLEVSKVQLKRLERTYDTIGDTKAEIMSIVNSASVSLSKLLIAQEYEEYHDDLEMHGAAHIASIFNQLKTDLQRLKINSRKPFLMVEIDILEKREWNYPVNIFSSSIAKVLLEEQFSFAYKTISNFLTMLINYFEQIVVRVLIDKAKENVHLRQSLKMVGREIAKVLGRSFKEKMQELINLEKKCIYTCNGEFYIKVEELKKVKLEVPKDKMFMDIDGLGRGIRVDHLRGFTSQQIKKALDIKRIMVVYFEIVVNRLVDHLVLNLHVIINDFWAVGVKAVMKKFITGERILPDVEPTMKRRRRNLECRIGCLHKAMKDIENWQVEFEFLMKSEQL
ncbi:hypothetical protein M8C21_033374, partial [Ambrosia artemisiifolia]